MIHGDFTGDYNNFQQYWKENTEDEIHKDKSGEQHRHLHINITPNQSDSKSWNIVVLEGRENSAQIYDEVWKVENNQLIVGDSSFKILTTENGFCSEDKRIICENDVLTISSTVIKIADSNSQYVFHKCRYFSGWIQYPPDLDNPDDLFSLRDLTIHDQGGIAEIQIKDKWYTVELTQLVFAHTIFIMKLAIYDVAIKDLEINTKSISYTWTNPDAKRIGLNLRHIISGWTLIEPGFINSNNLNT